MASTATAMPFEIMGAAHLGALGVTAVIAAVLIHHARCHPDRTGLTCKILAGFLLLLYPAHVIGHYAGGSLNRENAFPCHLCDIAAIIGAVALLTRRQRLAELVWFWGLAGTLNGLITPALSATFPSPAYFAFFALHGGVVVAALYLVAGLRLRPEPGAIWRAFGWGQVYLAATAAVDLISGANYGFLRAKPPQASLLDLLGPWPWYILALDALAVVLFTLLYLPFLRHPAPTRTE